MKKSRRSGCQTHRYYSIAVALPINRAALDVSASATPDHAAARHTSDHRQILAPWPAYGEGRISSC